MTIELKENGYAEIMDYIQKIETLAWEGIFPEIVSNKENAFKKFEDIISELRSLTTLIQENLLIVPKPRGPDGPRAA